MANQLQRSRSDRIIGGVCGGLAEHFNMDPVLVRVILVIITLMGGAGLLLYLVLWAVLPLAPPPPPASA
jgi:phage shock protein C